MGLSEGDMRNTVIQWLAVDSIGNIGWFNSEGCRTPSGLPDTLAEFEEIFAFTDNLPFRCVGWAASPGLDAFVQFNGRKERRNYLESFEEIAQLGMYAFDKTEPHDFENAMYHLVLIPDYPLNVRELPNETAMNLSKIRFEHQFPTSDSIDISSTFW